MLKKHGDEVKILAGHGRWIACLRDDFKVLDQRLHALELRVSTVEFNLTELAKLYSRLDIALSKLETKDRLAGKRRG